MQQQFDAVVAQLTGGDPAPGRTQSVTDAISTAAPSLQVSDDETTPHRTAGS